MLVEHTFISTFENDEAFAVATDLLRQMQFVVADVINGSCTATRGKAKADKAKRPDESPQKVVFTFDRGRVTVVASITPRNRAKQVHTDIAIGVVTALEASLGELRPLDESLAQWRELHDKIDSKARRDRVVTRVVVGILILLVVLLFAAIVFGG